MTFRDILRKLVDQTPGAQGAAVVDAEGIAVDEYSIEGSDLDLAGLAVEFQGVLSQATKIAGSALGGAPLSELMLRAGDHQLLLRRVDDEFFLVVALGRDGVVGKVRYLADLVLLDLRSSLASGAL
jgi:predicted regulator of Ras-like GTPase activity (Roadblock/LC7/MglB family)